MSRMIVVRQPLRHGYQGWCDPAAGVIFIDPAIPDDVVERILIEAGHEILGDHANAPHVVRPRPALRVVEGGRGVG